jgi:hypothetical protein
VRLKIGHYYFLKDKFEFVVIYNGTVINKGGVRGWKKTRKFQVLATNSRVHFDAFKRFNSWDIKELFRKGQTHEEVLKKDLLLYVGMPFVSSELTKMLGEING